MKSDEEILAELGRAAEGLLYVSETDSALEPVRVEGEGGGEPGERQLRELAGKPADAPVEVSDTKRFFRNAVAEADWKGEAEIADARRYQNLVRVLNRELSDLRVYRVGEIQIRAYVLGKSPSGTWLGLSTLLVET
ncbi:MAG TPA: nuclease A inhibitor family protein [Pyrinomonadaceae bacterium]|nr:nuclease A inhibitor family protein [Pyrinomonadaceae bacterium]